jgi:hypothetical protein
MESSFKGLPPIRIPEGKRTESTELRATTLLQEPVGRITPPSQWLRELEERQRRQRNRFSFTQLFPQSNGRANR